ARSGGGGAEPQGRHRRGGSRQAEGRTEGSSRADRGTTGRAIIDRVKWRIPLPEDRTQRTLVLAIATSLLFHLFVLVPFVVVPGLFQSAPYVKRGEPLLVDIAPERPEEKAPLGNPSRPVAPPESVARPAPPAPRMAPAPPPGAPAAPPAPGPAPAPPPRGPMGKPQEPTPPAPEPSPSETAQSAPAPAAPSPPQVAAARPPSIWR